MGYEHEYYSRWRYLSTLDMASSSYLYFLAHNRIALEYNEAVAKLEQTKALFLLKCLKLLKHYGKRLKGEKTLLKGHTWKAFIDTLKDNHLDIKNLFQYEEKGIEGGFLKDFVNLLMAIDKKRFSGKNKILEKRIGKIQYDLGKATAGVTIDQNAFANSIKDGIVNPVMEEFGIRSQMTFETEAGKMVGYGVKSNYIKVDAAGNRLNCKVSLDYDINKVTLFSFSTFAALMLSATFSLKNYSEEGVPLKKQQILRAIFDLLLELSDNLLSGDVLIAFTYALVHRMRYGGSNPNRDDLIDLSLKRIDFIYRLTGRGQTIDPEINLLSDLLRKGAKYLIYNEKNSDNIYVNSTDYLIWKRLNNLEFDHSMQIAKGLISHNTKN